MSNETGGVVSRVSDILEDVASWLPTDERVNLAAEITALCQEPLRRAVLEIHRPAGSVVRPPICLSCTDLTGNTVGAVPYPCPTASAAGYVADSGSLS